MCLFERGEDRVGKAIGRSTVANRSGLQKVITKQIGRNSRTPFSAKEYSSILKIIETLPYLARTERKQYRSSSREAVVLFNHRLNGRNKLQHIPPRSPP